MELFFSIGYLIIGVIIAFVGFERINPLHNKPKEKQTIFYQKYGVYLRLIGITVAIVGLIRIFYLDL